MLGEENQFVDPQVGRVDSELLEMLRARKFAKTNLAQQLVLEFIAKNSRDNATAIVIHVIN